MNDAVLTVQRIMSVLDILQPRPEREGFAVLSFQPGQPKAAWVCYGGERLAALEAGYRMLGHAAEFWVQDIAETLSWGPAAVAGEVEYQSWGLEAAPATGQIPVQPNYSAIAALQADLALDAAARIAELQTKLNAWIAAATETGRLLPDAAGMPRATASAAAT